MTCCYPGQPESMVAMHSTYILADWPGIMAFIRRQTDTQATQLDGRAIRAVYEAHATKADLAALNDDDRALLVHLGTGIDAA